eukprot:g15340.t1
MSTFFLNQEFPSTVIDRALNQVRTISRTSALMPSLPSRNSDRVPLVLIYHLTSIHIQKVVRRHFCYFQQDATTRHIRFPCLVCLLKGLFPPGYPGPLFLHHQHHPIVPWHLTLQLVKVQHLPIHVLHPQYPRAQ